MVMIGAETADLEARTKGAADLFVGYASAAAFQLSHSQSFFMRAKTCLKKLPHGLPRRPTFAVLSQLDVKLPHCWSMAFFSRFVGCARFIIQLAEGQAANLFPLANTVTLFAIHLRVAKTLELVNMTNASRLRNGPRCANCVLD